MKLTTTGGNNTVVGRRAFENNTTGSSNNVIGYNALFYNTTGTQNVAIGQSALQGVTTGSGNVGIGHSAGDNITTADNSIVIGSLTARTADSDNELTIGGWVNARNNGDLVGFGRGGTGFARKHVTLSGRAAIPHNTWTTDAYLSHSHSGICTVLVFDSDKGSIIGGMTTAYGGTDKDTISVALNGLTDINYRYNNSGYVLQIFQANNSSANRWADWSWTGISIGEIYVTS
jgi:hypothetical protein